MSDNPEEFANWLDACGAEALEYKKLHPEDRAEIMTAKRFLQARVISPDPKVQRACLLLMTGAYLIGAHANVVSKSAKIYQDERDHGAGGKKGGGKAAREQAEKWRRPARQCIIDNDRRPNPLKSTMLARKLKKEEGKPGTITYPEFEYFTRFIRNERKKLKAADGKNVAENS